jgi:hypothetical protein
MFPSSHPFLHFTPALQFLSFGTNLDAAPSRAVGPRYCTCLSTTSYIPFFYDLLLPRTSVCTLALVLCSPKQRALALGLAGHREVHPRVKWHMASTAFSLLSTFAFTFLSSLTKALYLSEVPTQQVSALSSRIQPLDSCSDRRYLSKR